MICDGFDVLATKILSELTIRTRHSEYRYRITDPHLCRGVLTGGMFDQREHDAILTDGPLPGDLEARVATRLQIGACGFFLVAIEENVSLLTTSTILADWIRTAIQLADSV